MPCREGRACRDRRGWSRTRQARPSLHAISRRRIRSMHPPGTGPPFCLSRFVPTGGCPCWRTTASIDASWRLGKGRTRGLSVDTSSCPTTCIFSVRRLWGRHPPSMAGWPGGRPWFPARFPWICGDWREKGVAGDRTGRSRTRQARPSRRRDGCCLFSSGIAGTCNCGRVTITPPNGAMSGTTPSARGLSPQRMIGHTKEN